MTPVRVVEGVDSLDVDGEVVVWDGRRLHLLDVPAASVWRLIDGRRDADDIAGLIAGEFAGATVAQIAGDVRTLLQTLADAGLVSADSGR